jgi:hypothetical protein
LNAVLFRERGDKRRAGKASKTANGHHEHMLLVFPMPLVGAYGNDAEGKKGQMAALGAREIRLRWEFMARREKDPAKTAEPVDIT